MIYIESRITSVSLGVPPVTSYQRLVSGEEDLTLGLFCSTSRKLP